MRGCSVEGCERPFMGRINGEGPDYCGLHYKRVKRNGSPEDVWENSTCGVEWCDKPRRRSEYCESHLAELRGGGIVPQGFKRCGDSGCGIKPLSDFGNGKQLESRCAPCRKRQAAERKAAKREARQKYLEDNAEIVLASVLTYRIDPESPDREGFPPQGEPCTGDDCEHPIVARGLCTNHYNQAKRSGALPVGPCVIAACNEASSYDGPCRGHREEIAFCDQRWCPECRRIRPKSDFYAKRSSTCSDCSRTRSAHWKSGNPSGQHGIDGSFTKSLLEEQGHRCAICSLAFGIERKPVVDHDHEHNCPGSTGCSLCVRNYLCPACNYMCGMAQDNPILLSMRKPSKAVTAKRIAAGVAYLSRWNEEMTRRGVRQGNLKEYATLWLMGIVDEALRASVKETA